MGSVADFNASLRLDRKNGITKTLLHVSNDIYYYDSNDEDAGSNETDQELILTQEFIDSLKPGDKLILTGDGSCW